MIPVVDRILAKCVVDEATDCLVFTGSRIRGYGRIGVGGSGVQLTHRVMYQEKVGPIPAGLDLDHLCRNRSCCNPEHLEPVTRSVNLKRSPEMGKTNRAKTHCPAAHAYDDVNTYVSPGGSRSCRTCATTEYRALRRARAEYLASVTS